MTTDDVELVIQRTLESLPKGGPKPRIVSDNGPQDISTKFRSYLRDQEMVHSRIWVGHSQSNGKIERIPQEFEFRMHSGLSFGRFEGADHVTKRVEDRKPAIENPRKIRREKRLDILEQNRSSASA